MQKEKEKDKRTVEEIMMGFFPDIDRDKLRLVLKDDEKKEGELNSSPQRKNKTIDNNLFYESAQKLRKTKYFLDNESDRIEDMFEKKESKYFQAVKKSVTTATLPNPIAVPTTKPNPVAKRTFMPGFLKQNIKKIHQLSGKFSGSISLNRFRPSALKLGNTVFTLFVTGSEDTDFAFRLLTKNFSNLSENHKSVFIYLLPNVDEDLLYNYRNKRDILVSKYLIEMRNLDVDRFFFAQEISNPKEYPNNISHYYKFCCQFPFSFSFFGYKGLRGPRGDNLELKKNLKFLMRYHKEPFVLNKLNLFVNHQNIIQNSDEEEKFRSYSWLFVFDLINKDCFKCFKTFSKLIDFKKDKVNASALIPSIVEQDFVEPMFKKEMDSRGITKFVYTQDEYISEASAIVKRKVNFESEHYDFVVIYNSINNSSVNKINYEKQHVSNYEIITECLSNICVHNGL